MKQVKAKPDDVKLSERLASVHVGVRRDLEVTRHVFRGKPSYVVREPLSLQNYELRPFEYAIFGRIDPSRTLGEVFKSLVDQDVLALSDEEIYYEFILTLHRLGFLRLPFSDEKLLYRRYLAKQRARGKEKLRTALFFRIPLVNPDAFLDRTYRYVKPLFTRWAFLVWLLLICSAGIVAVKNSDSLFEPIQGVLVARNLFLLWCTLIILKLFHEFGHAYACKHFGGQMPEMGIILILMTPAAYVDASACWGFPRKRDRIIVCLAGMYVELTFAAIAVFVWTLSSPGLTKDLAYNVILLASLATILFNVNPLMRFDGYYVLSDILEIPNLRSRSGQYVIGRLKQLLLGIKAEIEEADRRLRAILFSFGVLSTLYRVMVITAICSLIAFKLSLVGLVLAGFFAVSIVGKLAVKAAKYLWFSDETAQVRLRAVTISCVLVTSILIIFFLVPIPSSVVVAGSLTPARHEVILAEVDGFVHSVPARPGQDVKAGTILVQLQDDQLRKEVAVAEARVAKSEILQRAFSASDPTRVLEERRLAGVVMRELARRKERTKKLAVCSQSPGRLLWCPTETDIGRFVRKGDVIGRIAVGKWRLKTILTSEQVADIRPKVGNIVEVRSKAAPGRTMQGEIVDISPQGSRVIDMPSLTHVGGGDIPVDDETDEASVPYFQIRIDLLDSHLPHLRDGLTCRVRLGTVYSPIGTILAAKMTLFINKILQH